MIRQKIVEGQPEANKLLEEGWLIKHVFNQKIQIGSSGSKGSPVEYQYRDAIHFVMEKDDGIRPRLGPPTTEPYVPKPLTSEPAKR